MVHSSQSWSRSKLSPEPYAQDSPETRLRSHSKLQAVLPCGERDDTERISSSPLADTGHSSQDSRDRSVTWLCHCTREHVSAIFRAPVYKEGRSCNPLASTDAIRRNNGRGDTQRVHDTRDGSTAGQGVPMTRNRRCLFRRCFRSFFPALCDVEPATSLVFLFFFDVLCWKESADEGAELCTGRHGAG